MTLRRGSKWIEYAAFLMVLGVALVLNGCSSEEVPPPPDADILFQQAMAKYKDGDYQEAYNDFRIITLQYQGSTFSDDAQFYMGECKFQRQEYILAAYEYDVLIRTMPTSEFVPNARFQKAMCYYHLSPRSYLDQQYTQKAIDEFQSFIEYHPTDARVPDAEAKINELNTKLAKKEYDSGIIYMKMQYYRAATVTFEFILEKYHDTSYAEPALLKKAESLYERRKYSDALAAAALFLDKYPKSALRSDAESVRDDAQSKMVKEQRQQTASANTNSTSR